MNATRVGARPVPDRWCANCSTDDRRHGPAGCPFPAQPITLADAVMPAAWRALDACGAEDAQMWDEATLARVDALIEYLTYRVWLERQALARAERGRS